MNELDRKFLDEYDQDSFVTSTVETEIKRRRLFHDESVAKK
jgi:hypothetical protein